MDTRKGDATVRFILLLIVCSPIVSAAGAGFIALYIGTTIQDFWTFFMYLFLLIQVVSLVGITWYLTE